MGKILQLNDREINLNFEELNNLDLEEILTINYSSIKEDLQIFPFVANQLNFLLVEATGILNEEEFKLEVLQSNLDEYKAKTFIQVKKDLIDNQGEKNPTISFIENQIKIKDDYKNLLESIRCQKKIIAESKKNRDYLNGLYWSASSKMNILVSLAKNINFNED